jgi:hypothetical protein
MRGVELPLPPLPLEPPEPEEPEPLELPDPLLPDPLEDPEPELPEPVLLPEPLVPPELLLPEPLEPLLPPVPLLAPEPLPEVLLEPLLLPELLDPLELLEPEPLELLVLLVPPLVLAVPSPLLPPQAVSTQARAAMSSPLRANDVFISDNAPRGQHRARQRTSEVQSTCHPEHKCGPTFGAPVAKRRPNTTNAEIPWINPFQNAFSKRISLLFPPLRPARGG